jgi:hypothetical protein
MHMNNNRMQRLIDYPANFTMEEVNIMASLIGCEYTALRDLAEKAAGLGIEKKKIKKQNN